MPMKNLLFIFFILYFIPINHAQDTFSICAIDTVTGEVGSAGASCIGAPQIPQGCYILSDVLPGIGVIHTQAWYNSTNQNYAHNLMVQGLLPQQFIDSLVANDAQNNSTLRQYGVVRLNQFTGSATSAAFTGVNCDDYKNHIIGPNYTIQGNILLGQQILDSMEARFLATEGELACKLMAAMQGAKVIGADTRCLDDGVSSLSSFLRVAQSSDLPDDLYLDFNIPSTPDGIDPIDSLQTLVDQWVGCLTTATFLHGSLNKISIYPNPAADIIHFQGLNSCYGDYSFLLVDITGKEILYKSEMTNNYVVIPVTVKNGLYFYILKHKTGNMSTGKIVIQSD